MASGWRDEVSVLEHATLKVPYELLNKKFRSVQKIVDREVSHANASIADLSSSCKDPSTTTEELIASLDGVAQKINTLKRKAEEGLEEELASSRLCKTRIDHIKPYEVGEHSSGEVTAWRKVRLNRLLVDHFLREGHYGSAIALAESADIVNLVDVNVFQVCQRVEEGLMSHNTGPCLAWCHDNRSKLRRLRSTLEYRVRLQDFVELVRQERRMDAVRYARKYLSSGGEEMVTDLKAAMALLAFNPDTDCKKYRRMFAIKRWEELVIQFRAENLSLYQLNSQSVLAATLQCGLSALKTRQCYKTDEQNIQCPVCSSVFNELGSSLPFSHSSQSYLICRMSGQPMNEYNPPMLLPNGHVYGEQALMKMADENDGIVNCIRTNDSFNFTDVKKVFVM